MAYEKDPNEIGALWAKTGSKGDYMTGEVNGVKVVCFRTKTDNPNAPAWRVLKSKPKDEKRAFASDVAEAIDESDVPF